MTTIIKDWVVQTQWDDSKINKGLRKLERSFAKIDKAEEKSRVKKSKHEDYIRKVQITSAKMKERERVKSERNTKRGNQAVEKSRLDQAKATNKQITKDQNKITKSAKDSASVFAEADKQRSTNQQNRLDQAVKTNKQLVKDQGKITKSAKASADVFKESFDRQKKAEKLRDREYQDALRLNKAYDRRLKLQNNLLDKAKSIERRLERQATSIEGVRGSEGAMQGVKGRQATIDVLKGSLLSGGLSASGLVDVQRALRGISVATAEARPEITRLSKTMSAQQFVARGLKDSIRNLTRSYISMFAVVAGGVAVFNIGEQLDQTKASLLAVSGDAEQVAKDWQFIRNTALGLGVDLKTSAKGFQQIGVAAKTMGFSVEQGEEIFLAAAEASRAFNLSTEDQLGVQRAFVQIMS